MKGCGQIDLIGRCLHTVYINLEEERFRTLFLVKRPSPCHVMRGSRLGPKHLIGFNPLYKHFIRFRLIIRSL